jgi:hypothetical protein
MVRKERNHASRVVDVVRSERVERRAIVDDDKIMETVSDVGWQRSEPAAVSGV